MNIGNVNKLVIINNYILLPEKSKHCCKKKVKCHSRENRCNQESKEYNLQRFIDAQNSGVSEYNATSYSKALEEIKNGKSHWIWYIFPQLKGLGHSKLSKYYGIDGEAEAKAYIENSILKERLIESTKAVMDSKYSIYKFFGSDIIKFRSCMKLFASVSDNSIFKEALSKYHWS